MYFYSSTNKTAPQLNNEWGDMNRVINYILDGGEPFRLSKIEYIETNRVRIYADNIPFAMNETILVNGSLNESYNKKYIIESINPVENSCVLYNSAIGEIPLPDDVNELLNARINPCGMFKKFGGVEEQRTVFKSANGMEYRIDDRNFAELLNPPVEFNSNWQKVCRVSMSDNYDSLDSAIGRLVPYNETRPTDNFMPDGNYIGEMFMIYNQANTRNNSTSGYDYIARSDTTYPRGKMNWRIFANERVMYIHIISSNSSDLFHQYTIGEYQSHNNIKSAILHTHCFNTAFTYVPTATSWDNRLGEPAHSYYSSIITSPRMCVTPQSFSNNTNKSVIFDADGNSNIFTNASHRPLLPMFNASAETNSSGKGRIINNLYLSKTYLTNVPNVTANAQYNNIYGELIDILWFTHSFSSDRYSKIMINDELYIYIITHSHYNSTLCSSEYLIKLDVP